MTKKNNNETSSKTALIRAIARLDRRHFHPNIYDDLSDESGNEDTPDYSES